jgi:hypothetical protein
VIDDDGRDNYLADASMPMVLASDYDLVCRQRDELREAADEALNVLIGCAIPAGGVDDRKAVLNAQAMLRKALAGDRP